MKSSKNKKERVYDGEDLAELIAKFEAGEIDYDEFYTQLMAMD